MEFSALNSFGFTWTVSSSLSLSLPGDPGLRWLQHLVWTISASSSWIHEESWHNQLMRSLHWFIWSVRRPTLGSPVELLHECNCTPRSDVLCRWVFSFPSALWSWFIGEPWEYNLALLIIWYRVCILDTSPSHFRRLFVINLHSSKISRPALWINISPGRENAVTKLGPRCPSL